MKTNKYILIGTLLGLLIPLSAGLKNIFSPNLSFDFLFYNPIVWMIFPLGIICPTEKCVDLVMVVAVYVGWGILGGLVGFLIFKANSYFTKK